MEEKKKLNLYLARTGSHVVQTQLHAFTTVERKELPIFLNNVCVLANSKSEATQILNLTNINYIELCEFKPGAKIMGNEINPLLVRAYSFHLMN